MSRMSLLQLRSILLQNVTMFIFVVINLNAAFPSFFFEGGGGGGEVGREKRLCTTPRRTERSLTGTKIIKRFLNKP